MRARQGRKIGYFMSLIRRRWSQKITYCAGLMQLLICQRFVVNLHRVTEDFEAAAARVESDLGLTDQPRALVLHEKEGVDGKTRRHAHAVWSRIDTENMKAVQLSHDRLKLRQISRELYLEHGWKMPRGLINTEEKSMKNFTHAEWEQAKRSGEQSSQLNTLGKR